MAVVGAIAGVVFGALSYSQQRKSAQAQEKAMRAQQRAQELADARARRQLIRQSAIARGETLNIGASLGAMGGTGLAGGLSGLTNQAQAQLGFQQSTLDISKYITQQNIRAANAMSSASMFANLGDTFGSFFKSLPKGTAGSSYNPVT